MIDEQKKIEESYGILDRVPVGVCVLRKDLTILFWNSCLEEWTKIPRHQIVGSKITHRFPRLHQPKYTARLKPIFMGGPPTIFSSQIHKYLIPAPLQNGQYRIQQTMVTAVPALSGEGFYALVVIQDVTDMTQRLEDYKIMRDQAIEEIQERQRVEEALRASERFIQQIADSAPYLIYIYDILEKQNIYVNQQFYAMLGYTINDIKSRAFGLFVNLIHPEDSAKFQGRIAQIMAAQDEDIIELDYRIQHQSGEWYWFRSRERIFTRNAEGLPKQILGSAQDITDYKRAEEALLQQTEREQLMAVIAQKIRQSLNLNEILTITVTEVQQFLQADRVIVFRFDPDWSGIVTVEAVGSEWTSMLGAKIYDACFVEKYVHLYQQGRIQALENIYTAGLSPCHIEFLEQFEVQGNLVVPILQSDAGNQRPDFNLTLVAEESFPKNSLWGLLIAHQCRHPRRWQPLEINLLKQLATQVAIAIQQAELYQQLQAANQQLQRLATSDGLTHIANRRRFDEYLSLKWRELIQEQQPLSLIMCDVDFFKPYNDTYGHQLGDDCLRLVAKTIENTLKRSLDLVARYGGEEFAVILPQTNLEEAALTAQQIRANVKALKIEHQGSLVSQYVTVSMGVASILPTVDISSSQLIAAADKMLYLAKAQGRDRVEVYQSENPQLTLQ